MLNLPQDFRDLLQILEANNVQYLIVGGYALSLYATPRTTGDLDIFVKIDPENATRILQSLNEFGFGGIGITQEDLLTPSQVFQLGYPPNRIDFLTGIEGVSWEEAFSNRQYTVQNGIRIPVIGQEELIKNKLSTGRQKDFADVESIRHKMNMQEKEKAEGLIYDCQSPA